MHLLKSIPNFITFMRIGGTLCLFCVPPFSFQFFIIYGLCGISDVLDGFLARKLNAVTKAGQILDSCADCVFFLSIVYFCFWFYAPHFGIILWIGVIFALRALSAIVGYKRFSQLIFLHTYANKLTGLLLFAFPLLVLLSKAMSYTGLCLLASAASAEEFVIMCFQKTINRDIHGIWELGKPVATKKQ